MDKMNGLKFNKQLTGQYQGNEPSVIFRKLPETGNNARYQGSINVKGVELIKSLSPDYKGLKVVFSDLHPIIGFKPLEEKGVKAIFGATELFRSSTLNLVIGKRYKLTVNNSESNDILLVIDSNEYKK